MANGMQAKCLRRPVLHNFREIELRLDTIWLNIGGLDLVARSFIFTCTLTNIRAEGNEIYTLVLQ